MLSPGHIRTAKLVAGFLLAVHVLGLIWFFSTLTALLGAYGVLVVVALSAFCFFPRSELPRNWVSVAVLAALAGLSTLLVASQDISLVGGADYGALVGRALVLAVLSVMCVEAVSSRRRP